jgi:formylglycine-generating enzyme
MRDILGRRRLMLCAKRLIVRAVAGVMGAVWVLVAASAGAASIDWVTVGDPGNAADTTGFGAVDYTYQISKYQVTNAQYAEFLNAKAASDPLGLYNTSMGSSSLGGITRSGSDGSFSYAVQSGMADKPVNFVSFFDALRFTNWLHNGQGSGDTETGAYTLLGGTALPSNWDTVTRNAGAGIFLTSEDEWYKAAYYDALSASYFAYPAGTDTETVCAAPGATPNTANCDWAVGTVTDVGAYTGSASPYGTFDQGGNVWEWNEAIIGSDRGLRGGAFFDFPENLAASLRDDFPPAVESLFVGFRVAMVPEPGTGLLLMGGLLGLALWRRRGALPSG